MSTAKQTAANRRNAQKSSGPRSAEGKAASRVNSLKTGLYARSQIIAGEDPAELRALAGQYFLRWEPATPEESFLVATLVDSDWLLRRYSLADAKIWDYQGADDSVRNNPHGMGLNFIRCREYFPLLQRRIDSAQRSFHRALHDLERLQTKRTASPQSIARPVTDPPPEAKPNSARPQSAQQKIGFVPSFSSGGTDDRFPSSVSSPIPAQAAVTKTVTHPTITGGKTADATTCYTPGLWHSIPPHGIIITTNPTCAGPCSDLIRIRIGRDARRSSGGLFICAHNEPGFCKV